MPVINPADKPPSHRLALTAIIVASLALVLAALACVAGVFSLGQGYVELPPLSVRLGHLELAAPCPQVMNCDIHLPYYAIWFGHDLPNGSVQYEQLYFVWLVKKKH